MKKTPIAILILLLVAVAGGAYYYYSGKEYVFRFSESQIQERLNTKLPVTKTYLLIFQVILNNPRVSFTYNSKRVGAGLDVILNIRIRNATKPLGGSIDVSGGVKYVPSRGELFLTDPIADEVDQTEAPLLYSQAMGQLYIPQACCAGSEPRSGLEHGEIRTRTVAIKPQPSACFCVHARVLQVLGVAGFV